MSSGSMLAAWLAASPGERASSSSAWLRWEQGQIVDATGLGAPGLNRTHDAQNWIDASLPVSRRVIVPALSNAHDHARTFRSSSLGGWGRPLESWLPLLSLLPGVDPYLVAASSLARSLRRGATAIMVHYTRMQGTMSAVDEALAVARAARDLGIQIGFAVSLRDARPLAYCDDAQVLAVLRPDIREGIARRLAAPQPDAPMQMERFSQIAAAIEADSDLSRHVTVQLGPTAVQWCSPSLLASVARASADENRPVHMHLLETRYQREWADRTYPDGIVRYLDELGLLSARLTLAHCTWARREELDLLAERGVTIAVNTSSNLLLRSGIAPVSVMREAGCRIAMGLDGLGFDEDDDPLREMRLAGALHRGWGFETSWSDAQLWQFASAMGRRSVLGAARDSEAPGGRLDPGYAADFLVLDIESIDDQFGLIAGVDPIEPFMARACADSIHTVVARGTVVVSQGRVAGVDEVGINTELTERTRAAIAADSGWASWRDTLSAFHDDLGPFYRSRQFLGCC